MLELLLRSRFPESCIWNELPIAGFHQEFISGKVDVVVVYLVVIVETCFPMQPENSTRKTRIGRICRMNNTYEREIIITNFMFH